MDFELGDHGDWKAEIDFRENRIQIRIDSAYPRETLEQVLKSTLKLLDQKWPDIEESIIKGLHETYNEEWVDPDAGYLPLSEGDFLSKIKLQTVSLLEGDGLDLFFDESGLFGGHRVNVYVGDDRKVYPAELYG